MKKILFIQPYYFYVGHYYNVFTNLINNLKKFKHYNFLVSVDYENKIFLKEFSKINKDKKIYSFKSSKKIISSKNIFKSFLMTIKLRNKFDIFFYYDVNIFILSTFYFFSSFLFKKKKIIVFLAFPPFKLDKGFISKIYKFFIKNLIKNNNQLYLRTESHSKIWIKTLNSNKYNIKTLKGIDYPNIGEYKIKKNGRQRFGAVGQIREGKSLKFLNKYFTKNKDLSFSIIGGFPNTQAKKNFSFLNKKFLSKKNSLSFNEIVQKTKKLDYIICLYEDRYPDLDSELGTFFLAAKLKIPIIFFKKHTWLRRIHKKYKFGIMINTLKNFSNFPKRNSKKYDFFIKEFKKYSNENLDTIKNERIFYSFITQ